MFEGSFLAETCYDQQHAAWRALAARLRGCMPDSERVATLAKRIEAA
jgi:hypothetical protein